MGIHFHCSCTFNTEKNLNTSETPWCVFQDGSSDLVGEDEQCAVIVVEESHEPRTTRLRERNRWSDTTSRSVSRNFYLLQKKHPKAKPVLVFYLTSKTVPREKNGNRRSTCQKNCM